LSDISLSFSVFDLALLALLIGWPGIVVGAALGVLVWPGRRLLGCGAGALIGWAVGIAGFYAWTASDLHKTVDFAGAVVLAAERASPGLLVGAAIGGAARRSERLAGAAIGALVGGALSATAWFALAGGA